MPKIGRNVDMSQLSTALYSKESTQRGAPFGNSFTPTSTIKIIGGKVHYIDENSRVTSRSRQPITDKPNHIDPRQIYNALHCKRVSEGTQTSVINQITETDSSGQNEENDNHGVVNPYPIVPPITLPVDTARSDNANQDEQTSRYDQNFFGNYYQKSFIPNQTTTNTKPEFYNRSRFDNEHVTSNRSSNTQADYANLQRSRQFDPCADVQNVQHADSYTTSNYIIPNLPDHQMLRDELTSRYLNCNEYLPRDHVILSPEDDRLLMRLIKKDMKGVNSDKLKQIYLDLAENDKSFSLKCTVRDLTFALAHNKVFLAPDLLRLVASKYISNSSGQMIYYEDFLLYLGHSLDAIFDQELNDKTNNFRKRKLIKEVKPFRREKITETGRTTEIVDLLQMIEGQLVENNYVMDVESLARQFQLEDRNLRGTLSISQICDVCYRVGLPLQQTIIDRILSRCDRSSGGQYSWTQFVEFLEKVQPLKTGLNLPRSKRPLEYARQYPAPLDTWPKSPVAPSPYPALQPNQRTQNTSRNESMSPDILEREAKIDSLERKLEQMRKAYEKLQCHIDQPQEDSLPWFQRFTKLANAVYAQDVNNTGRLSLDSLNEIVRLYNKAYNLHIPKTKIDQAVMKNYDRGSVAIHPVLSEIGLNNYV